ncbi:hypothetical protein SAMN05216588_13521 [Pseudomonas flavescens]|uniref:Uncharacterized protein n=1 Tax=Phytopseudomonas flavescens TaxID=29435 RepID=A0A1G8QG38_9GAMM|nr:hypothetical protein SAMN05216588_13521 [Pseudomonas flavescens]
MTSLSAGVWGSFTTPCSRALGGKSGMTRAAPLVSIIPPVRITSRALFLLEGPLALLLPVILLIMWVANLPPDWRFQPSLYTREQPCQERRGNPFIDPTSQIEREVCETAGDALRATARRARGSASGEARMSERWSGSVQNGGASEARASALTSL